MILGGFLFVWSVRDITAEWPQIFVGLLSVFSTAMGFGLAGFFTGIMAGDFMAKKGAEAAGLDGKTLSTLMGNFLGAFKGATGVTVLMSFVRALAPQGGGDR